MPQGSLDWTTFEGEWDIFLKFATDDENPRRAWDAWSKSDTGNHLKVRKTLVILLERLASIGWGSIPSMSWMCDLESFDIVFCDHSKHLKDTRTNNDNTRAQQLRNIKRPLEWAVEETWLDVDALPYYIEDWWTMAKEDRIELVALFGNVCKQASTKGRLEYKQRREGGLGALELDQSELHERVEALEKEALIHGADTTEKKLTICEASAVSLLPRAPRGVELYKLVYATSEAEAANMVKEDLLPGEGGGAILIRHDHGSYRTFEIYAPDVKKHVNRCATNHDALLDLFFESVPLRVGEFVFTPNMHGLRDCKAKNLYQFDSSTWSDYIKGMTKRRLGVPLRPNDLRRIRSTHATRFASEEVLASTAASMATSTRRMFDTYSQTPMHARTWLSTQVNKFEFDHRFGGRSTTVTVPTVREVVHSTTPSFVPARLVRIEGPHSVYALFAVLASGDVQLTGKLYRLDQQMRDIADRTRSSLILDPTSASQRWRNGGYAAAKAGSMFAEATVDTQDWAARATITGDAGIQVGDMVYSHDHSAIAEVKATQGCTVQLLVATETSIIGDTHSKQAQYRFEFDAEVAVVNVDTIVFPIDLSFDGATGVFVHRLSANLETV